MKFLLYIASIAVLFTCGKNQKENQPKSTQIKTIVYENLVAKTQQENNTLYVINFWATWCKPCVEELPDFIEINSEFKENPHFKMYLVTLDFVKNIDKVKLFVKANAIDAEVVLLNDNKRMNDWIPKIDKEFSGAIPATVIYKNKQKVFFKEGKLTQEELKNIITKNL